MTGKHPLLDNLMKWYLKILDSTYQYMDLNEVSSGTTHLNTNWRELLQGTEKYFEELFYGIMRNR